MPRSFLAAIRSAVTSAPELVSSQEDQPGAEAPTLNAPSGQTQGNVMADDPNKPGATTASGITQAALDAAIAAARAEGHAAGEAAGAKATNDKLAAIISAEGIKGNAGRMAAAIDLAVKSPGMSTADVTAFVSANVAATAAPAAPVASLANRVAAAASDPLAISDQPSAAQAKAGWDTAFGRTNAK